MFKKKKTTQINVKPMEPETLTPKPLILDFNPTLTPETSPKSEPAPKKLKLDLQPVKPTAREIELEKRFNVSKRFLTEYGPRLIQSHDLWTKNSKILRNSKNDVLDRNPLVWSVEEVVEYISYIPSCQDSCKQFRENAIDGSAFLCLTKDDIENVMKIKVGPSIKILSEINHLREEVILRFKI